jgi:hypothetical protein
MAGNPTQFGRVQVAPQGVFGTAAGSGFLDIEAGPVAVPVGRNLFDVQTMTGRNYMRRKVVGRQTPEVTIPVANVNGVSLNVPTGNPTPHGECELLRSCLGNRQAPSGYAADAVSTGSSTTAVKVKFSVAANLFRAGDILIFGNHATAPTQYAAARVTAVTEGSDPVDHTLTVAPALPFTPPENSEIYGTVTTYEDATTLSYLTLDIQSLEQDSRAIVEGCICTEAKYTIDPAGVIVGSYALQGHQSTSTPGSLADWPLSYPRIPPAQAGRVIFGSTAEPLNSLEVTFTLTPAPFHDHNAAQGLRGFLPVMRTAQVVVNRYVQGAAPAFDLELTAGLFLQFGDRPGRMFVISIPAMNRSDIQELSETEGLWSQSATYLADRYVGDTAGGSASANAAFCVAFG